MKQSHLADAAGLIFQKQAQIQALWAVYTAVQFTEGGFAMSEYHQGGKEWMPLILGISVLAGTWAFNFGHLAMILGCLSQSDVIKAELSKNAYIDEREKPAIDRIVSGDTLFPVLRGRPLFGKGYGISICIHLFIDACASIALLSRVEGFGWLRSLIH